MGLSEKQLDIIRFRRSPLKILIADGCVRAGKTVWMAFAAVTDVMERYNRQRFGICGKTVSSAYKNIVVPMMGMTWFSTNGFSLKWKSSENTLVIKRGDKENYFELFGGKDEASYSLIQGRTLCGILVDEVTLLVESFFNQAVARCSVAGAKLWFNCNPSSPDHWFKRKWIDSLEAHSAKYLHFELTDNPGIGEEQRRLYETSFTGVFYQRYIQGLWVMAEGAVYTSFDESRHMIDENGLFDENGNRIRFAQICVGQDFGGNKSKNTLCAVGITQDYRHVYVLKAVEAEATGVSVDGIVSLLDRFCTDVEERFGRVDYVFADSAEQAIINTERNKTRWNIRNSIKNEIIDRVRAEDLLMTSGRLHILRGQADSLVSAIKSAVWDEKAAKDTRLDIPGTTNICPLDAFEYSWEAWIKNLTAIGGD